MQANVLAGVGGADYKEATRRTLRRVMRDDVAVLFSLYGRKQKLNFSVTIIKDVIIGKQYNETVLNQ